MRRNLAAVVFVLGLAGSAVGQGLPDAVRGPSSTPVEVKPKRDGSTPHLDRLSETDRAKVEKAAPHFVKIHCAPDGQAVFYFDRQIADRADELGETLEKLQRLADDSNETRDRIKSVERQLKQFDAAACLGGVPMFARNAHGTETRYRESEVINLSVKRAERTFFYTGKSLNAGGLLVGDEEGEIVVLTDYPGNPAKGEFLNVNAERHGSRELKESQGRYEIRTKREGHTDVVEQEISKLKEVPVFRFLNDGTPELPSAVSAEDLALALLHDLAELSVYRAAESGNANKPYKWVRNPVTVKFRNPRGYGGGG